MKIPRIGVLLTVTDARQRPLVILRRTKNDTMSYIFKRYKDMTTEEKAKVKVIYDSVIEKGMVESEEGTIGNIDDFLNFTENKLCG
jgi:hypothetical protein